MVSYRFYKQWLLLSSATFLCCILIRTEFQSRPGHRQSSHGFDQFLRTDSDIRLKKHCASSLPAIVWEAVTVSQFSGAKRSGVAPDNGQIFIFTYRLCRNNNIAASEPAFLPTGSEQGQWRWRCPNVCAA
jgi:hypothetical protein